MSDHTKMGLKAVGYFAGIIAALYMVVSFDTNYTHVRLVWQTLGGDNDLMPMSFWAIVGSQLLWSFLSVFAVGLCYPLVHVSWRSVVVSALLGTIFALGLLIHEQRKFWVYENETTPCPGLEDASYVADLPSLISVLAQRSLIDSDEACLLIRFKQQLEKNPRAYCEASDTAATASCLIKAADKAFIGKSVHAGALAALASYVAAAIHREDQRNARAKLEAKIEIIELANLILEKMPDDYASSRRFLRGIPADATLAWKLHELLETSAMRPFLEQLRAKPQELGVEFEQTLADRLEISAEIASQLRARKDAALQRFEALSASKRW